MTTIIDDGPDVTFLSPPIILSFHHRDRLRLCALFFSVFVSEIICIKSHVWSIVIIRGCPLYIHGLIAPSLDPSFVALWTVDLWFGNGNGN